MAKFGRVDYWDEEVKGLGLRCSAHGGKVWVAMYRARVSRIQRRYRLGAYPRLSLADARREALRVLRDVELGGDPAAEHRERLRADTFGELAEAYLKSIGPDRDGKPRKRTWIKIKRIVERELLPKLGNRKADSIERGEIRAILNTIYARAPIQANRVLEVVRRIFSWGIEQEQITCANPCARIPKPAKENKSERWLRDGQIFDLWQAIDSLPPAISAWVRLIVLTGQRPGECLQMRKDDIDRVAGWWVIPGEIAKNGEAHSVALNSLALEALDQALALSDDPVWVFPKRGAGGSASYAAAAKRVARMVKTRNLNHFAPHALRATVASHMDGPLNVKRATIAKVLNHADPSITGRYVRHSYDLEKRAALDAWGERVTQIIASKPEVVELRRA